MICNYTFNFYWVPETGVISTHEPLVSMCKIPRRLQGPPATVRWLQPGMQPRPWPGYYRTGKPGLANWLLTWAIRDPTVHRDPTVLTPHPSSKPYPHHPHGSVVVPKGHLNFMVISHHQLYTVLCFIPVFNSGDPKHAQ